MAVNALCNHVFIKELFFFWKPLDESLPADNEIQFVYF